MIPSTFLQKITAVLLVGLLLFISCRPKSEISNEKNIARVGERYLSLEEAERAVPSDLFEQDSANAIKQQRQQWIQQQLILREADRLNLAKSKEVQHRIAQARYEVLRDALRRQIMAEKVDSVIPDREVKRYYEANKEHLALSETFVQFRHLQTKDIEAARAAKIALEDGEAWEVVAANYADHPNRAIQQAKKPHALSTVLRGNDVMKGYLQNMRPDQISPIQRIDGLYHFVQLLDRREEGEYAGLEWIEEELKKWILIDRRKRKFNSYLKNLYLKAQSDNEIDTFNVISTNSNTKNTTEDTLESN
ncbi:MAG TPA: peptidyl-prolyl cis-trans isomerase [Fodinibius sp.]|nr:peptidyl-prolyl cis-trans isomerase [Fodinibius sp.]